MAKKNLKSNVIVISERLTDDISHPYPENDLCRDYLIDKIQDKLNELAAELKDIRVGLRKN